MESSLPKVIILMPLRDDWAASAELIRRIDQSISSVAFSIDVLLVDDGSQTFESSVFPLSFLTVRSISILRLRRNVGHQRAIAIGLMHIKETISSDAIVVMDADGEDTPEGLGQLLNAYFGKDGVMAVFAERTRRLESFLFRSFYLFYKVLHWAFTGVTVRVGNFSVLPPRYLSALSVMPELWSHYAAAVFRSRLPLITITIPRGLRIAGKSKMNFVALVSHGLSAIAVFADVVGARLLTASLAGILLAGIGIAAVIAIRLFTDWAIPGWATYATGLLAIILTQFTTIAASFTFTVLSSRTNLNFLPVRDYAPFIAEIVDVYPHGSI